MSDETKWKCDCCEDWFVAGPGLKWASNFRPEGWECKGCTENRQANGPDVSKWRAESGGWYWCVKEGCLTDMIELNWGADRTRHAAGNYFKTKAEARASMEAKLTAEYNKANIDGLKETTDLTAAERKATPVYSGFMKYFPLAMQEVARCSVGGNQQHNPDKQLHWDRSKSGDELDALTRHLLDAGKLDSDGLRHSAKVAWRAMANLEKELEGAAEKEN